MLRLMALISVAAMLSACGTTQKLSPPTTGVEIATITFTKGPGVRDAGANYLSVLNRPDCVAEEGWGAVAPVSTIGGLSRTFQVQAGRPLYFHFMSLRTGAVAAGGGVGMYQKTCQNVVSFTPEAGRTYTLQQATPQPAECVASAIDGATNSPPPTLQQLELSPECERYGNEVHARGVW